MPLLFRSFLLNRGGHAVDMTEESRVSWLLETRGRKRLIWVEMVIRSPKDERSIYCGTRPHLGGWTPKSGFLQ